MPGSDVEHVSCYLDGSAHHFPHPSSQLSDQCFDTPADGALNGALISPPPASFLATTTYSPSRPDLLDSQQGHPPPSSPLSEYPDNHNQIQHSLPNPDDYYRNHGVPLAGDSGVNPSDTSATGPSVDTNERLTLAGNATSLPTDTLESSRVRRPQYRSVSYSAYKGPENGPVRTPRLPYSDPRSRQPSFKDLVNKFNNNPDQILPLPSVPRSREASRAGSPAGSVDGQIRSRASSRLRETPDTSTQRQPTVPWDPTGSELPYFSTDLAPPPLCIADNPGKHVDNPEPLKPSRHQLFSELLPVDTGFHNSGVGIPGYLRRRGSDGSIPSPNPASLDHHGLSPGLSPLTPTAWYLGHTQRLDAVNSGGNTNNHRRTRSDLTGSQILPAFADPNHSMAIPGPLQMQPSGLLETPHSKSRIPISSRRLSPDSVSGSSSRSLGPNSTFSSRSATYGPVPVKGTSRLPIPSPKGSPDEINDSREPLAILSPGPGRTRRQTPEKNSLLTAYIAAPPPKKSPPLRSSRPRQPVTNATSSPPRSKVGQTVSNFQSQINRDRESRSSRPRQRRLPELGNVDFAIRRQRIQQAFNRTVQENERKEEEEAAELRHREQEQGGVADRAQDQEAQPSPEDPTIEIHSQAEDTATVIDESTQISDEEKESITENEGFRQLPQLHIDTSTSAHEASEANADHHLVTMDSPTLGLSEMAPRDQDIVRSDSKADNMPPSAATPGSTDTHVTAFDQEPQTGLTRRTLNMSHRTLLNQIMQIRESSSSSSSCDEPEYSFSDNDDAESIPIMLRDTSYSESHRGSESNRGDRNLSNQRAQAGNEVENRWSMSSWSFSLRNQPSAYEQCEASGDEISYRPASPDSDPTTQSCSGTSSTPPSVSGFHQSAEPTHHGSQVLEQRNEQTAQRNACMPSNAPSLARQGGWDSKRVAQLYLEELARGRGHHFQLPTVRAGPEPQPSDSDWKSDRRPDSLTDDPVLVPRFDDALSSDRLGHAASLVFRDDWEHASPSIADWMQVAAEDEAALPEDKSGAISIREGSPTPRVVTSRMQQEGLETRDTRLGLAINVELPQGLDSEDTPPPPLPRRSPPPPPEDEETSHPPQAPLDPPASHSSSSAGLAQLGPINSAGSSENSSLQRLEPIPSPQLVDSSATSLVPSNPEHASIEFQKKSPSPEQRRLKKRLHVIKELIDTEYTFGRDMKVVDDIYKGTSSSCLDLSAEDVKVLFANSDQIVQFSTMFQDALKDAARSVYVMPKSQRWSSKRTSRNHNSSDSKEDQLWAGTTEASELEKDQLTFIGEAFMTHISRMEKVYTDYLKNHDAANKKLQSLQRNPKVAIWLKECRDWAADLTTAWDLDSLLVKPVQRIVKYPLLLDQLLSSTPSDHPDGELIAKALEEVTNISVRINEMKKRADLVGQVVGRKRKESDVRAGLSKAFGRRTEKLKQHVGLSDMFEDKGYDTLSQRFGDSYFQLQVVMRDVEMYAQTTQASMDHLNDFVGAIEGMLDVSQSIYSELEGKWRELRIALHEVMTIALPDHVSATLTIGFLYTHERVSNLPSYSLPLFDAA